MQDSYTGFISVSLLYIKNNKSNTKNLKFLNEIVRAVHEPARPGPAGFATHLPGNLGHLRAVTCPGARDRGGHRLAVFAVRLEIRGPDLPATAAAHRPLFIPSPARFHPSFNPQKMSGI